MISGIFSNFTLLQTSSLLDADATVSELKWLWEKVGGLAIDFGQKLIAAIVVYLVGRWLIKLVKKLVNKLFTRNAIDPAVQSFLTSLVSFSLNILLFIGVVGILGVSTTSFAALIAAAGLAIGMAMKDNLANFAGGVMILINKPFRIGHQIEAQGMNGVVKSIGILYTVLTTPDNRVLYIPNGPLSTGSITNYSNEQHRRVDLSFTVCHGNSFDTVKGYIDQIIKSDSLIVSDPEPAIVMTIKDSTIEITVRAWCLTANYWTVMGNLQEGIYKKMVAEGILAWFPTLLRWDEPQKK
jgi:small conductance mechanosensitive channel